MQLVEPRAPWIGVVAGALLAVVVRVQTCAPDDPYSAPRLAWAGDGYLALWDDIDGDETVLYAGKVAATGPRTRPVRHEVWRSTDLRSRPHLAASSSGALAIALEGPDHDPDPDKDRSDPLRFLSAVPIATDGRALATARELALADRICASPTWDGERFAVGFAYRMRGFGDDWVLQVAGLSADAEAEHIQRIDNGQFRGCAVARRGDTIALVVAVEDRDTRAYSVVAYLLDTHDYEPIAPPITLVRREELLPWPEVAVDGDHFVVTYADRANAARLVRFDRNGVRSLTTLAGVDGDTMSLGSNAAGAFVAWHADGQLWLRTLGDAQTRSLGGASRTETAAAGHDRHCAVAWSDRRGTLVARMRSCN